MASNFWAYLRPLLVTLKRQVFFERPFGLAAIGKNSIIKRPRTLHGREFLRIGDDSSILEHSFMLAVSEYEGRRYSPSIQIGTQVYVGRYVYLVAANEISIGSGSVLSEQVYITDMNHGFDPSRGPIMQQAIESKGPVKIGPNCFLGYRVAVMPGVTLGEWCIVGANSVVTRSFPGYSMIAGSPARLIKVYSHELGRWLEPKAVK